MNGTVLLANGTLPAGLSCSRSQQSSTPGGLRRHRNAVHRAAALFHRHQSRGVNRLYQGGESPATRRSAIWSFSRSAIDGVAGDLEFAADSTIRYSITISGQQLPNVPLQKAGIVLDYKAPHSVARMACRCAVHRTQQSQQPPRLHDNSMRRQRDASARDADVCGEQHHRHLRRHLFEPGQRRSVSRRRAEHRSDRRAAADAAHVFGDVQRQVWSGRAWQRRPSRPSTLRGARRRRAIRRRRRGARGGGGGEGGGFRNRFRRCRPRRRPNPLAVADRSRQRCTADAHASADALDRTESVRRTDRSRQDARPGIPQRWPHRRSPMQPSPITVSATPTRSRSCRKGTNRMRALAGAASRCTSRERRRTAATLRAANTVFFVPQITFMPAVGLYFVARQAAGGSRELPRLRAAERRRRRIRSKCAWRPTCTGDAKNIATQALGELRAYFATGAADAASWTITAHTRQERHLVRSRSGRPAVIGALLQCGRVATATTAAISRSAASTASRFPNSTMQRTSDCISCVRHGPGPGHGRRPAPTPWPNRWHINARRLALRGDMPNREPNTSLLRLPLTESLFVP